jgi:hypothetical protein
MDATLTAALVLSVFFTLIIAFVSILQTAKVPVQHIFSFSFVLYLALLLTGNGAATLIVAGSLTNDKQDSVTFQSSAGATNQPSTTGGTNQLGAIKPAKEPSGENSNPNFLNKGLGGKLPGPVWMWAAFLGVFGFQVILTRVNITVFGQGVLTIEDWIAKAQDAAVVRANEILRDARFAEAEIVASRLAKLPIADLNAHVTTHLGATVIKDLEAAALAANANAALLKAQALATQKPYEAKAIV